MTEGKLTPEQYEEIFGEKPPGWDARADVIDVNARISQQEGRVWDDKRPPTSEEMAEHIIRRQHREKRAIERLIEQSRHIEGGHHLRWVLAEIADVLGVRIDDRGIAP